MQFEHIFLPSAEMLDSGAKDLRTSFAGGGRGGLQTWRQIIAKSCTWPSELLWSKRTKIAATEVFSRREIVAGSKSCDFFCRILPQGRQIFVMQTGLHTDLYAFEDFPSKNFFLVYCTDGNMFLLIRSAKKN